MPLLVDSSLGGGWNRLCWLKRRSTLIVGVVNVDILPHKVCAVLIVVRLTLRANLPLI